MRRTALAGITAALLAIGGCQGGTPDDAAVADAGAGLARECNVLGAPTVVRYQSHEPAYSQHAVHLMAGDATTARANGCRELPPVASVVTLRYRVTGS
jgi:hypothetical protein